MVFSHARAEQNDQSSELIRSIVVQPRPSSTASKPTTARYRLPVRVTIVFTAVAVFPLAALTLLLVQDGNAPARTLIVPIGGLALITVCAALIASLIVTEPTTRALRQLERVVRHLRTGDYTAADRLGFTTELGPVAIELRRMAADLGRDRAQADLLEVRWSGTLQELELQNEVLEDRNLRLVAQYDALQQFAGTIARMLDPAQISGELLSAVRNEVDYDSAAVFLVDPASDELVPVAVCEHGNRSIGKYLREISDRCPGPGRSIADWCRQVGRTVRLDDLSQDGRWTDQDPGIRSVLAVPLEVKERIIGVLHLDHREPRRYRAAGVEKLVTMLARQAALSIEHSRLLDEIAQVEALRRLDRLKSELLSNVSHELRTPLAMIKGYASSLLREDVAWDGETRREFLQVIDEESDRLRVLIDDLLQMSEIEAGILRIHRQPVKLKSLVHRVIKRLRSQMSEHTVSVHIPSALPIVLADPGRVEQVLRNLLTNAVKYAPTGGTIRVSASTVAAGPERPPRPVAEVDATHVLVSVRDEGIGIATEHLDRIFERFYRVEGETARKAGGSGLGLAICRGIIEAHGGRIWAESRAGEGSTFYFTLPVVEGEIIDVDDSGAEES